MSFTSIDPTIVQSLEGIAAIAFSALSAYAVRLINTHVSAKNLATVESLIATGVKAAQQLGAGKVGSEKKAIARTVIIEGAARLGIPLTDAQINNGIEAAVTDLKAMSAAVVSGTPPTAPTAEQAQAAVAAALRTLADQMGAPTPATSGFVSVAGDPITADAPIVTTSP